VVWVGAAAVRGLRQMRSPATPEELDDYETDLLAGLVLPEPQGVPAPNQTSDERSAVGSQGTAVTPPLEVSRLELG
jgi:hypothetical protein